MKVFHAQAQMLIIGLRGPRCHGPLSKRPKRSLHVMGITYEMFRATAQMLKTAAMAT